MSGHSKWSKVKHQKASTDALRGKLFTKLTNAIIIAVKTGGGVFDPQANFKLRLAIEKARSFNLPRANIERAIEKVKGSAGDTTLTHSLYEGFGPYGVGILIEVATDNKQRTVAQIKNTLDKAGGRLAAPGSVSHIFNYMGEIVVKKEGKIEDVMEAAIDAGAEDLEEAKDTLDVYTNPQDLHKIKDLLSDKGFEILSFELLYKPQVLVKIDDPNRAEALLKLLSSLDDLDDVLRVYANIDI